MIGWFNGWLAESWSFLKVLGDPKSPAVTKMVQWLGLVGGYPHGLETSNDLRGSSLDNKRCHVYPKPGELVQQMVSNGTWKKGISVQIHPVSLAGKGEARWDIRCQIWQQGGKFIGGSHWTHIWGLVCQPLVSPRMGIVSESAIPLYESCFRWVSLRLSILKAWMILWPCLVILNHVFSLRCREITTDCTPCSAVQWNKHWLIRYIRGWFYVVVFTWVNLG